MAVNYITTDQTTSVGIADGNEVVVLDDVSVSSTGTAVSGSENTSAHILGTVVGANGVSLGSTTDDDDESELFVGETGEILSVSGLAVSMRADTVKVTNLGTISSSSSFNSTHDGIAVFNHLELLSNFGAITSGGGPAIDINGVSEDGLSLVHRIENHGIIHSGRIGINAAYNSVEIVNTGRISGAEDGINAISFSELMLVNSGTISGGDTAVAGVNNDDTVINSGEILGLVNLSSGDNLVDNSGLIAGDVYLTTGNDTVVNTGEITGYVDVQNGTDVVVNRGYIGDYVLVQDGEDMIRNSGTIAGDVDLGDGADTFNGKGGTVEGTVYGGNGDDTYIVSDDTLILEEAGGQGTDLVKARVNWTLGENFENLELIGSGDFRGVGNGAENTITGNEGDNRLTGKGGNDTVNGADGNDRIFGGIGEDRTSGDEGDDFIRGGISNDKVYGGDDDDMLRGNRGDDVLFGGGADDTLVGGVGRDTLFGGVGQDSFVFTRAGQSATGAEDVIRDFTQGEDLVDLSGLNREVTFIGTAAYSSGGAAEARTTEASGDTYLHVDLDGDGSAEMTVRLMDVTGLTAADLLL